MNKKNWKKYARELEDKLNQTYLEVQEQEEKIKRLDSFVITMADKNARLDEKYNNADIMVARYKEGLIEMEKVYRTQIKSLDKKLKVFC